MLELSGQPLKIASRECLIEYVQLQAVGVDELVLSQVSDELRHTNRLMCSKHSACDYVYMLYCEEFQLLCPL